MIGTAIKTMDRRDLGERGELEHLQMNAGDSAEITVDRAWVPENVRFRSPRSGIFQRFFAALAVLVPRAAAISVRRGPL
jgi:hypothetical protein